MKEKRNRLKKTVVEMIIIVTCGLSLISISSGLIFGIYRPFVPWQKVTCVWSYEDDNKSVNTVKRENGKYVYRFMLDGVYYEVPLKVYSGYHSNINTRHIVFVNRDNPYQAKAGQYGTFFLVVLLILLAGGVGTVAFAFINYRPKAGCKNKCKKNNGKKK